MAVLDGKKTENVIETSGGTINGTINERALSILNSIATNPGIKKDELSDKHNLPTRTLSRSLQMLMSEPLGLIEYQGSKKTGGYVLTEKGLLFVQSL